jgi:hypothetical protein
LLKNVFGVQIWFQTIANKRRCAVCAWQTLATGAKKRNSGHCCMWAQRLENTVILDAETGALAR